MHIIWKQHNNYGDFGSLQTNLHLLRQKKPIAISPVENIFHSLSFCVWYVLVFITLFLYECLTSVERKKRNSSFFVVCSQKSMNSQSYELRLWISFESTNVNIKRSANDLFFRSFLDVCTRGVNNMKGNLQSSNQ